MARKILNSYNIDLSKRNKSTRVQKKLGDTSKNEVAKLDPNQPDVLTKTSQFGRLDCVNSINGNFYFKQVGIASDITSVAENTFANLTKASQYPAKMYIGNHGVDIGAGAFFNYGRIANSVNEDTFDNLTIHTQSFQGFGANPQSSSFTIKNCEFDVDSQQCFYDTMFADTEVSPTKNLKLINNKGDLQKFAFSKSKGVRDIFFSGYQEGFEIKDFVFKDLNTTGVYTHSDKCLKIGKEAFKGNKLRGFETSENSPDGFANCYHFGTGCFSEAFEQNKEKQDIVITNFTTDSGSYKFEYKSFYDASLKAQDIFIETTSGIEVKYRAFESAFDVEKDDEGQDVLGVDKTLTIKSNRAFTKSRMEERAFAENYFGAYSISGIDSIGPQCFDSCKIGFGDVTLRDVGSIERNAFRNFKWTSNNYIKIYDNQPIFQDSVFHVDVSEEDNTPKTNFTLLCWGASFGGLNPVNLEGQTLGFRPKETQEVVEGIRFWDRNGLFSTPGFQDSGSLIQAAQDLKRLTGSPTLSTLIPDCSSEISLSGDIFEAPELDEDAATDDEPLEDIVPDNVEWNAITDNNGSTTHYEYAYFAERTAEDSGDPFNTYRIYIEYINDPESWEILGGVPGEEGWYASGRTAFWQSEPNSNMLLANADPSSPVGTYIDLETNKSLTITEVSPSTLPVKLSVPANSPPLYDLFIDADQLDIYNSAWKAKTNFCGNILTTGVVNPEDPQSPE